MMKSGGTCAPMFSSEMKRLNRCHSRYKIRKYVVLAPFHVWLMKDTRECCHMIKKKITNLFVKAEVLVDLILRLTQKRRMQNTTK